ncbi:hypothetical protein OGAPHI_007215 [Ogataea philodendri]|uniref:PHD-type domain-containing protein n=1 Tax=Ogataea philodendri TaxID=1378263 RepID=A0A9P8NUY2_9ASCO|nr:uncharacterized protein OGAPHI_007215 [Ogataea philodendri]KAH3660010.1 hypothetical protein OGAPHI_007215 [Ogataea philodendri]
MSKVQLQERYNKFSKAAKFNLNSEELFCVCRSVDDGELMVACDGCDEWFHFRCMKLDSKYKDLVNNFYCIFCNELFHKGSTLWKKKCRLEGCYKPVRIDNSTQKVSKYCCDEHGVEYMQNELLKRFSESTKECKLSEPEIVSVITQVDNFTEFQDLGKEMPIYQGMDVDLPEDKARRLDELNTELAELKQLEQLYVAKEKYMVKLKEKIKLINEKLAGSETGAQTKKSKKPKVDVCGYDSRLIMNNERWSEFEGSDEYKKMLQDVDLGMSDDQLKSAYEESQPVLGLCMVEKKKCIKHATWFSIQYDTVMLKLNEILYKIAEVEKTKSRLDREWNLEKIEQQSI